MTNDENESSIRFEDEMGVHHSGKGIENSEVERKFDFEVETEPVFKRLANDIYRGHEAGIREPITNSITSVIRACEEGYLDDPDEGIILIQLYEQGNALRLTLRDNGVGITRDELDRVVTQIGKSTSRSDADLTGKFGMGFLATWMLTGGTDGGFGMYSNPRGVDEGPFFGFWDNQGFSEMEPPEGTHAGLDDDEYGVEFEIFIDQSIDRDDLLGWIDKYSEWTRVPVLFRHHTEEGVVDEEYPPKNLEEKYSLIEGEHEDPEDMGYEITGSDELRYYKVENDAFTAINSNLEEVRDTNSVFSRTNRINNCILMDVPIQPDWKPNREFPLESVEIRLNYETPVVVDGPHEGYFVVTGEEDPDSLGQNYISHKTLTTEDVVTPYPTGTRDMLQDEMGFIEWLSEKFYKMYYEDIAHTLRSVDTIEDYCELSDDELESFHNTLDEITDSYSLGPSDIDTVESRARTSFSQNLRDALPMLINRSISVAPRGEKGVSRKGNRQNYSVSEIVRKTHNKDDREVFMAHRITQERAEFVWAAENHHYVVRIASGNQQKYQDAFGWKNLGDLDFETDLEVSDEERKRFTEDSTNVEDEQVTLHVGNYSTTKKMTAKGLKENMQNDESVVDDRDNENPMTRLIIFHRTDDNISDHQEIVGSYIGSVSVSDDVYDYLEGTDGVWTTDILENGVKIPTSEGDEYNIPSQKLPEEAVYHIVDEETAESFREPEIMEQIQSWIRESTDAGSDIVYVPITPEEKDLSGLSLSYRTWTVDTQFDSGGGYRTVPVNSDVELYVKAVLGSSGNEVLEAMETVRANWSDGGEELVQLVEEQI